MLSKKERQNRADEIDLKVFNLARALFQFGEQIDDADLVATANRIESLRFRIRRYMSPERRQETEPC